MLKLFGTVAGAAIALLTVQTAQAQDAKAIVAKTNAAYHNLKTIKVSLQTTMTMDKQSSNVTTEGQFIPGQKANLVVTPKTPGKPMMRNKEGKLVPTPTGKQGAMVVDDGRASYMMDVGTNQYVKQPHNPNIFSIMGMKYGLPFGGMDPNAAYYKLLADANISGVPCFTLQLTPPSKEVTTTVLIYVDKATYRVKEAKITQSNGKQTMTAQTLVKSETVNAPIANSVFTFAPPKGAQEIKPPPPSPTGK